MCEFQYLSELYDGQISDVCKSVVGQIAHLSEMEEMTRRGGDE